MGNIEGIKMDREQRLQELLKNKRMSLGIDNAGNHLQGFDKLIDIVNIPDMSAIELGSYEGSTAEWIYLSLYKNPDNHTYDPHLTCIDPWDTGCNPLQEDKVDLARAEQVFDNRMAEYAKGNWFKKIKMKSEDAAQLIPDNSVDFVYIDGDHRKPQVMKDIMLYLPKIKQSGYIAGHDYCDVVKEAVNEILGEPLKVFEDSSWVFAKKDLGKTVYDPVKAYDEIYENDPAYGSVNPDRDQYIDEFVKKTPEKILDAGCGQGHNVLRYPERNITGIEFSKVCFDKYLQSFQFINTDIISYSKTGARYDGVICTDVMEHIPESMINETLIALKRLGKSILFGIANHSDIKRGYELHLTQHNMPWWENKLKEFWADVKFVNVHNSMYYLFEVC